MLVTFPPGSLGLRDTLAKCAVFYKLGDILIYRSHSSVADSFAAALLILEHLYFGVYVYYYVEDAKCARTHIEKI